MRNLFTVTFELRFFSAENRRGQLSEAVSLKVVRLNYFQYSVTASRVLSKLKYC